MLSRAGDCGRYRSARMSEVYGSEMPRAEEMDGVVMAASPRLNLFAKELLFKPFRLVRLCHLCHHSADDI